MATYMELYALRATDDLKHRVQVACWIAAEAIRTEDVGTPNHANRQTWAGQVLTFGTGKAEQMLCAVLAANKELTVAQMTAATDAQLQTAVDNAVDLVALGA